MEKECIGMADFYHKKPDYLVENQTMGGEKSALGSVGSLMNSLYGGFP